MTQRMNKPEPDLDMEILVNSIMAAQNAVNAASAALRNVLRKRAGGPSGGTSERQVPPTFMARARRMVHEPDTPEEKTDAGQQARDGGSNGHGREAGDGGQNHAGGDSALSEDTARDDLQQG